MHPIRRFISLFLVITLLITSCIPNKQVNYFKNNNFNNDSLTYITNTSQIYRLQPGDILNVRVKTLDNDSEAYFNLLSEGGFNNNIPGLFVNSYSINSEGMIEFPEIGEIKVGGSSIEEAQGLIKQEIDNYLNNATVLVKLVSYKITVLGEVNNPGYYYVYNDRANILEGLGLAGDLTIFGDRKNVTLIRQIDGGSGGVIVDLRDAAVFSSEFYYLEPNDVIYVPPVKGKSKKINANNLTLLSVLFAAISATVLLLNYVDDK